ncbi:precorrin-6y C5,15-methyltransferase (decarboxylating) subunit CbiE [Acaryochloris sp. IP29b_bin.148]|uniref:precorrin-6y C5,15-methyltransferase (decarboxylating) subunit CbiE n=1 Tax=Acaryochloris sp. IP29b_bin.148 TaxID=2969218 RepID=UPI002613A00A|nr:precorrin-6y C5,15-methyltransferase (decarboxylating) subunit CbiE [Acaryochloris sp. IP29b_bin.148]
MTPIHVVGIGLSGRQGLVTTLQALIDQATLLVGSPRHLGYFPEHAVQHLALTDFAQGLQAIQEHLEQRSEPLIVVLTSGDPLFFGFGRLLLQTFDADQLCFHPYLSAVQIAFNRLKVPWQDAEVISVHGRSLTTLIAALQKGAAKIAVLTDPTHTPAAIAQLFLSLDLPLHYEFWVCENLEGPEEQIQKIAPKTLVDRQFSPLNIVVLLRQAQEQPDPPELDTLPLLGLSDQAFYTFMDRPGLMTKREIRIMALAELHLLKHQVIWDIGAGTGSVAIEIARTTPTSQIYAIEKTTLGAQLISQNCQRFQVNNVHLVHGQAPEALANLPQPDRIFIGGSGGHLREILNYCQSQLALPGIIVISLTTLENFRVAGNWFDQQGWSAEYLQVQLSRSVPVSSLTRFNPLNPVTLVRANRNSN